MISFHETTDLSEFDALEHSSVTQTFAYGEWHRAMGRKVIRYIARETPYADVASRIGDGVRRAVFQAIVFHLFREVNFLSIPHGPVLENNFSRENISAIRQQIAGIARRENAAFVRFDAVPASFMEYFSETAPAPEATLHSVYAQPQNEWILDLKGKTMPELLSAMHPKMRYNMGLAERHGVQVEIISDRLSDQFNTVFDVLQKTAQRDRFSLHPREYYKAAFALADTEHNAFLAIARYQGKLLAANFIFLFGSSAAFLYGGSVDEYKKIMAPSLIQREIIAELLRRGITVYNLGGVALEEEAMWQGFSIFKRRLGGHMISYAQPRDIILKPFWYWAWIAQKTLRNLIK